MNSRKILLLASEAGERKNVWPWKKLQNLFQMMWSFIPRNDV